MKADLLCAVSTSNAMLSHDTQSKHGIKTAVFETRREDGPPYQLKLHRAINRPRSFNSVCQVAQKSGKNRACFPLMKISKDRQLEEDH